ncbi:DUF5681 domain-containing protein [Rhodoplanes elegans]|uniref:DUF5681 domain-containing protein n=1 Tax=Rhodoplanes elegans TaxID=29408 RepID=UPI003B834AF3
MKGVSGNPRGRPRKTLRVQLPPGTPVRDRFLEEAQRIIQLREGDEVLQRPWRTRFGAPRRSRR